MRKILNHFCDSSIVEAYENHINSERKPLVIICDSNEHAERIKHTLEVATGNAGFIIPENETLPYDEEYPQSKLTSERFANINKLANSSNKNDVFLIPVRSLIERICEKSFYEPPIVVTIKSNSQMSMELKALDALGYKNVSTVTQLGEYAEYPNVIDIFPFGNTSPVRIYRESNSNKITLITKFDTDSQLNKENIESFEIYPVREFPFDESAIKRFRTNYRDKFSDFRTELFNSVKDGVLPRGIDYFKTIFTETNDHVLNFLPETTNILFVVDVEQKAEAIYDHFLNRYMEISEYRQVLPPNDILISIEELNESAERCKTTTWDLTSKSAFGIKPNGVRKQEKIHQTFKLLSDAHLETNKTLITINSETRLKQLEMMFKMKGAVFSIVPDWSEFKKQSSGYFVLRADLDIGFICSKKKYGVVTEFEIFDSKTMEEISYNNEMSISHITEMDIGNPIVHAKYGVGRFSGFESFKDGTSIKEYLILEYAESSKIWVSLDELHLVSEYKGINPEDTPLDSASSKNWSKNLLNAIRDVKSLANKLLKIKAKRKSKKRNPFKVPTFEFRKFANEFSYTLTKDQSKTIQEILSDLESDIAMDRLIVGDVGYGKTEVAMRAAMIVAFNKKQCSIIAPTTLLAEQHYQSFKSRFEGFNFNIELITRDKKSKEKEILQRLKSGEIDIIIGTHRLIQDDIEFKDVGLFVVDEEHRFGVKQKESINKHRGTVDILSLSATPIPRTLSMTMHGIRDISTINTAPAKRLAIRTVAHDYSKSVIHEALSRELSRSGQAFYLHNDTATIADACTMVSSLFPDADVRYAHGKMSENELHGIMQDFRNNEFDILVATTIIETGIDIPNANTIIITECDRLGLSQMHQLRGRVGRSNKQAYAYLLRPQEKSISETSEKRINAMVSNNNLGGGFKISNADLEIRGAGEILGESQSGHIQDIGYQMYFNLLQQAIEILETGGDLEDLNKESSRLVFYVPKSHNIPLDYINDSGLRAAYYKAMSETKSEDDFTKIATEMKNRFGKIPESVLRLIEHYQGKNKAMLCGVKSSKISNDIITITMEGKHNIRAIIDKMEGNEIYAIELENNSFSIPMRKFDRDGVIDYSKLTKYLSE